MNNLVEIIYLHYLVSSVLSYSNFFPVTEKLCFSCRSDIDSKINIVGHWGRDICIDLTFDLFTF